MSEEAIKRIYPSGRYINITKPWEHIPSINDIAWSLSMQCRFGGHCNRFYSVAEHSLFVAELLPQELKLQGLMHDAHEAYVQDLTTGMKHAIGHPWRAIEQSWELMVRQAYQLPAYFDPRVKDADLIALATERRELGLGDGVYWSSLDGIRPHSGLIPNLSRRDAYDVFLSTFWSLYEIESLGQKDI